MLFLRFTLSICRSAKTSLCSHLRGVYTSQQESGRERTSMFETLPMTVHATIPGLWLQHGHSHTDRQTDRQTVMETYTHVGNRTDRYLLS